MAIDFKYRIHEVAKDFGMTSKMIGQILTDYVAAPKNHMQVLEDSELDIIFGGTADCGMDDFELDFFGRERAK